MKTYDKIENDALEWYYKIVDGNQNQLDILSRKPYKYWNDMCCAIIGTGNTLLHIAIQKNKNDLLKFFLSKDVDIHTRNKQGLTLFHMALLQKNFTAAKIMLDAGINVNEIASPRSGQVFLHKMVLANRIDAVKMLLDEGANIQIKDKLGRTPLHNCAMTNNTNMASHLLERGCDLNCVDLMNRTPLFLALMYNNPDISKLFLNEGADINIKDKCGMTALHVAISKKISMDVVKLIVSRNVINVNSKEKIMGRTPLHIASEKKFTRLAGYLIDNGADINLTTHFRRSPLHLSLLREEGDLEIIPLLIKRCRDINTLTLGNKTALHKAVELATSSEPDSEDSTTTKTDYKFANLLLQNHANVNFRDLEGLTPLHVASRLGKNDIANLLISGGANVNCLDSRQMTPLHHAVQQRNPNVANTLLRSNADYTLPDEDGKTPLGYDYDGQLQKLIGRKSARRRRNAQINYRQMTTL